MASLRQPATLFKESAGRDGQLVQYIINLAYRIETNNDKLTFRRNEGFEIRILSKIRVYADYTRKKKNARDSIK
jgi:hypothetical protein